MLGGLYIRDRLTRVFCDRWNVKGDFKVDLGSAACPQFEQLGGVLLVVRAVRYPLGCQGLPFDNKATHPNPALGRLDGIRLKKFRDGPMSFWN